MLLLVFVITKAKYGIYALHNFSFPYFLENSINYRLKKQKKKRRNLNEKISKKKKQSLALPAKDTYIKIENIHNIY